MRKKHISKLFYGVALATLLSTSPAFAFGWPTFDIAEVFNTIQSVISQAQAQIATVQETISVANIQQAIGDKLGALSKIKDAAAKIKKAEEKAEKIRKRGEKILELKKKYEKAAQDALQQVQDKYQEGVKFVNDTKNQIEGVKNQVEGAYNDAKSQIEGVKNQVEGAYNNAKNQVEGVKNQVEGAYNNAKNQVDGVKNQVEGAVNGVKNQIDNAKNQAQDLYGGLQNGFGGTTNAADGSFEPFQFGHSEDSNPTGGAMVPLGSNSTGSTYSIEDGADLWGDGNFDEDGTGVTAFETTSTQNGALKSGSEMLQDAGKSDFSQNNQNGAGVLDTGARSAFKTPAEDNVSLFNEEPVVNVDTALSVNDKGKTAPLQDQEKGLSIFNEEPVSNVAPVLNKTSVKTTGNKTEMPADNATMRKAFGKVSYNFVIKNSFAAQSDILTGTDEEGNYYFPDTFAAWVGFNFDEKLDEDKMTVAVKTICDDLNSKNAQDVEAYKNRFMQIIKEARAHAEAYTAAAVGATESEKTTDDLSQMIDTASDSARTQLAGVGEIGVNEIAQNKKQMVMTADALQAEIFDEMLQYCQIAYEKEDEE